MLKLHFSSMSNSLLPRKLGQLSKHNFKSYIPTGQTGQLANASGDQGQSKNQKHLMIFACHANVYKITWK